MSISGVMAIYLIECVVVDFSFVSVPYFVGVIITMVAILGLINGTNMIDGFNGLSSGVCFIIFSTYAAISYHIGDNVMLYINLICMASLLGFLFFNFPKGRIFLGDGGAYSLGFLLAVISIMLVKRHSDASKMDEYISPWFALVSLIYPVWEVIFSFTRRTLVHRLSPLYPDSKHVHQLIFRNITKQNNPLTTLVIYPIVIIFNIVAILVYNNTTALFMVSVVFVVLYSMFYFYYSRKEIPAQKSVE